MAWLSDVLALQSDQTREGSVLSGLANLPAYTIGSQAGLVF